MISDLCPLATAVGANPAPDRGGRFALRVARAEFVKAVVRRVKP